MNNKGFAPVLILLTIVFVFAIAYISYRFGSKSSFDLGTKSTPLINSDSPSPTPNVVPTPVKSKIYKLSLSLKSSSNLPPLSLGPQGQYSNLADYLDGLFGLPKTSIANLYFDVGSTAPYGNNSAPYNSIFYARLSEAKTLKSSVSDQYISVSSEPVDQLLMPYFIKNDYCEQDSDCSIRANICNQGAYNQYQVYMDPPWGCGPGGYKDTYSWFKWGERDDAMNCEVELKFDGAKCEKNQCVETGYKKVCIN